MSRNDDDLIGRYIALGPAGTDPADALIAGTELHVWALIGYLRANDNDLDRTLAEYAVDPEAATAALAYYERHREALNARLGISRAADETLDAPLDAS